MINEEPLSSSWRRVEEPVRLEPSSAFEALLLARIEALDERVSEDIAELKGRLNWLIVVIVGTCLVFILQSLLEKAVFVP